jgi:hypothetical protein
MDMDYRIIAVDRGGEWQARAERLDTGDQFGIECRGATQAEAIAGMTAWLEWQQAHVDALHALQEAERAYHRFVVVKAFAGPADAQAEERQDSLAALDAAREALDAVRGRRPEAS